MALSDKTGNLCIWYQASETGESRTPFMTLTAPISSRSSILVSRARRGSHLISYALIGWVTKTPTGSRHVRRCDRS